MMAFAFWRGAIQRAFGLSRCGPDLRGWGASMGFGATGAAGSEATLPTGLLWQPTQHRIVPLWALTAARWRISAGRAGSR